MRKVLRFALWGLLAVAALAAALFGYFVYAPATAVPRLSGNLTHAAIAVGGRRRTFLTYVPQGLPRGAPVVMIMNGTKDPLNPFDGGTVTLFGFYGRGQVRSSRGSAQYFADLNHIAGAPAISDTTVAGGVRVQQVLWGPGSKVEIELMAIQGGG